MKKIEYNGNIIALTGNKIMFNENEIKTRYNKSYTYKLTKTGISTYDVNELFRFIEECIAENFGLIWIDSIINHMEKITK